MGESILTKSELEMPRTAAAMLDWVYAAHERFTSSKELRDAAREGKYFCKELIEEALPIALFAHRYYTASSDVTVTHVIGNQKYDASVDDRRLKASMTKYIEATVSNRDYNHSLRMELLSRDGHAPAYGDVTAKGPKINRSVLSAQLQALDHNQLRNDHIKRVIEAVERKRANKYPNGTALVILVDDYVPFRTDDDIVALDLVARETLVPLLSAREFCTLALEGSRAVHLSYELQSGNA